MNFVIRHHGTDTKIYDCTFHFFSLILELGDRSGIGVIGSLPSAVAVIASIIIIILI